MSLRVSEKYGVNASLELCFFCGKEKGVVLMGRLKGDVKAPISVIADKEPCDECKERMKEGVMFIGVEDGQEGKDEPDRMGMIVTVKDESVSHLLNEDVMPYYLKTRIVFCPREVWLRMGFPLEQEEVK
jgi:hypothetical protein